MKLFPQAQQTAPDGTVIYRWYVFVGAIRFRTWAKDAATARHKTEQRQTVKRLGLRVDRVEPAPSLLDEIQEEQS